MCVCCVKTWDSPDYEGGGEGEGGSCVCVCCVKTWDSPDSTPKAEEQEEWVIG